MKNLQDKIKAYVNNELAPTELADFEAELTQNVELQQEVQAFRDIEFVFKNEKLLAHNAYIRHLRDTIVVEPDLDFDLDKFLNEGDETPQNTENTEGGTRPSPSMKKWWWGAGLALMGLLGVVLYQLNTKKQQETTLKRVSEQHTSLTREVEEDNIHALKDTPLGLGMTYYTGKTYTQAIPYLKDYLQKRRSQEPDYYANLYLGISCLMAHQEADALKYLGIVANGYYTNQTDLSIPAKFYYALAEMAIGKNESVRTYLNQVKNSATSDKLSKEAADILTELDKANIK
jgi:hypothetical protein